jgi:hypothetical protein
MAISTLVCPLLDSSVRADTNISVLQGWKFRPRKKPKKETEEDEDAWTPKSSQAGPSRNKRIVNGAARRRPEQRRASTVPLPSTPPPMSVPFFDEAEAILGPCPPSILPYFDPLMLSEALDIALPPGRRPSFTREMTSIWSHDQQYWSPPSHTNPRHTQFGSIGSYYYHAPETSPPPLPIDYHVEPMATEWHFGPPHQMTNMMFLDEVPMEHGGPPSTQPHPLEELEENPERNIFQGYSFP